MNTNRIRVAKVGGSLFGWPGLVPALRGWLRDNNPLPTVLVAGGGALVERIRRVDQPDQLAEVAAHWMAIEIMGHTARWLQTQLGDLEPSVDIHEASSRLAKESPVVLDVRRLLWADEWSAVETVRLPASWDVSADSIAARVAIALGAQELVLLKSCLPEKCSNWREAAECGYVDHYFPRIATKIVNVRCVNLRDPAFGQWRESKVAGSA